jgi:cytochrome c2
VEAPKLMRGYNLVKDNGCFGCHEIAGVKGGRWIGPDLRLEPSPPLDAYTPAERARMTSDPLNPPGTQRKVGPSLRRLGEKTNQDWLVKWVRSPRDFRPDTKMPHFYGLTNNNRDALAGTGQADFPDTEIHAVVAFLLNESGSYLKGSDKFRLALEAKQKDLQQFAKNGTIGEAQQRELEEITRRLELHAKPQALADLPAKLNEKPTPEQLYRGRELFSERGCLACHQHEGTEQTLKGPDKLPTLPAITGEALFGPNLSRLAGKLGEMSERLAHRRPVGRGCLGATDDPQRQVGVGADGRERAVDVVGDAGDQLADRGHLLGGGELDLRPLLIAERVLEALVERAEVAE